MKSKNFTIEYKLLSFLLLKPVGKSGLTGKWFWKFGKNLNKGRGGLKIQNFGSRPK